VKQIFADAQEQAIESDGSDSYDGAISTCHGTRFLPGVLTGPEHEAFEKLLESAEKWADGVSKMDVAQREVFWLGAGWYAS